MGHFRDESLQAIHCTGTDNQKQGNTRIHTPETQNRNTTALAKSTVYTQTWYAFHDLRPEGPGPILTALASTGTEHLHINLNSKPKLHHNIRD